MIAAQQLTNIVNRFNSAVNLFNEVLAGQEREDAIAYENSFRLSLIEISTALEVTLKVYLDNLKEENKLSSDDKVRLDRPVLGNLVRLMQLYAQPQLDSDSVRVLRDITALRNSAVHGLTITPNNTLVHTAIVICRNLILEHLPVNDKDLFEVPENSLGSSRYKNGYEYRTNFTDPTARKYPLNSIHEIHLSHFKAFNAPVSLALRSLTVLCGLNSSGKSSIIDSILLLKQTLLTRKRESRQTYLNWSGPFYVVEKFEDIAYEEGSESIDSVYFKIGFQFSREIDDRLRQNEYLRPVLNPNQNQVFLRLDFEFAHQDDMSPPNIGNSLNVEMSVALQPDGDSLLKIHFTGNELIELVELIVQDELVRSTEYGRYLQFNYFLPVWATEPESTLKSPEEKDRYNIYKVYREVFESTVQILQHEIEENIKYLGPLRDDPRQSYSQRQIQGDDIGPRGEDTILILQRDWWRIVDFVTLPNEDSLTISWQQMDLIQIHLGQAVNLALKRLGMQEIRVEVLGDIRVKVRTAAEKDTWVTIADVGFGVSQILPVLVQGFLSNPDSILIFEQPELHLHPRAQAKLAEIFVGLARTGRRIIVETHSDHLINRLRRLVAEDMSNQLVDLVNIVFAIPTAAAHDANLEALKLNSDGSIANWPPGFLAETAEDSKAIVQAGIKKRRQSSEPTEGISNEHTRDG